MAKILRNVSGKRVLTGHWLGGRSVGVDEVITVPDGVAAQHTFPPSIWADETPTKKGDK